MLGTLSRAFPFAAAIFLGAFLLFQVQPMVAKIILPWFGGGTLVWTATLLFFQTVLLLGYGYAFILSKLRAGRAQAVVHLALVAASLVFLPIAFGSSWKPEDSAAPVWRIAWMFTATIGMPCVVLAATAPLLQSWFAQISASSPYRLYAISNAGSMLGLFTYPFVVEPLLGLHRQTTVWSGAFVLFALLGAACASQTIRGQWTVRPAERGVSEPVAVRLLWGALSAFGVIVLLATTNAMTLNLAPVPFLWVLPLSLYLLSFILCFAGARLYRRRLWLSLFAISILPTLWLRFLVHGPGPQLSFAFLCVSLFAGCMVLHGELAALQPERSRLTSFYLIIALGGVCGGAFVSLVAPAVFNNLWEHEIGLWGAFLLGCLAIARETSATRSMLAALVVGGAVVVYVGALPLTTKSYSVWQSRSVYGRVAVDDRTELGLLTRNLIDGEVRHGSQVIEPRPLLRPTLYYIEEGGIGAVFGHYRATRGTLRVGSVGLGTGSVAAYGRAGDHFRFYELNPDVMHAAATYFTFLSQSPAVVDVVPGDARLSLEREARTGKLQKYDLLVLDAFSSDAIPTHLMTTEAFRLYDRHLADGGALVVNVANTFVDMRRVVQGQARALGYRALLFVAKDKTGAVAEWAVLTRDEAFEASAKQHPAHVDWPASRGWVRWTDDHADLFGVLRW